MNKKYNMKKTTEVMKQKIFSLLLLMAATTLGAWAADTYKIHLVYVLGNSNSQKDITGVDLTSQYTIPEADIIELIRNAAPEKKYKSYETITLGTFSVEGYPGSYPSATLNTNYDIVIEKNTHPTDNDYLKGTYQFNIKFSAQETSSSVAEEVTTGSVLTVTVYHETHEANGTYVNTHATHHWQGCNTLYGKCELPDETIDPTGYPLYAAHTYGDNPALESYYTCQTPGCGYVNNDRKPAHAHNYSTQWYNITTDPDAKDAIAACDATKHWHKCTNNIGTCEASESRKDMAAHSFDNDAHDAKYYTCSVCSYVDGTRNTAHSTHTYAWKYDENQHWKECTAAGVCEALIDPGNPKTTHTYGATGDQRFTCTVCGYVSPTRKAAYEAIDANAANPAWSWDYEIPFPFDATNISNDRKLKTEQAYTICLPYDLKLNGLKVYFMEKMSDKLVGFREQTITELPAFTPCVVIAAAVGNPLSMAGGKVKKTTDITDRKAVGDGGSYGGNILKGSLKYIAGADAKDLYIMQAADEENPQGSFKKIADNQGDYGNANPALHYCVLPQRAYLAVTASPSREILNAWFFDANGTTKVVDRLVIDEDAAPAIYDLQGRKVTNPQRGGLYIINGKKMIMK